MITKEQIEVCRLILLKRQYELIQTINRQSPFEPLKSVTQSTAKLSSDDDFSADMEIFEARRDVPLKIWPEQELDKINSSLHAIEEGTYGICSVCGDLIPFGILIEAPSTAFCPEHAKLSLYS